MFDAGSSDAGDELRDDELLAKLLELNLASAQAHQPTH